ncbi:MAG: PKD domain-containing protein [Saprospiraceae bacterium]
MKQINLFHPLQRLVYCSVFSILCIHGLQAQVDITSIYNQVYNIRLNGAYISNHNVVRAEYYIDTDAGIGQNTQVTLNGANPMQFVEDDVLTNLPEGIHTLGVRVKDAAGYWSHTLTTRFFVKDLSALSGNVNANVVRVEYYIDTDAGVGQNTQVALSGANPILFVEDEVLNNLPEGIHTLGVRVKDAAGNWSHTLPTRFFVKNLSALSGNVNANVVRVEYYIDTDAGVGQNTQVTLTGANPILFVEDEVLTNLPEGIHTLGVRVKDAAGNWSHTLPTRFFVKNLSALSGNVNANVVKVEYYIDTDAGVGQNTQVTLTGANPILFVEDEVLTNLPAGIHTLGVRVKDAAGYWSHTQVSRFFVRDLNQFENLSNHIITGGEYFFDNNDQGPGNAPTFAINMPDSIINDEEIELELLPYNLAVGNHKVVIRLQDDKGNWSHSNTASFTVNELGSQKIKLTYPNGGEVLYSGNTYNITWVSSPDVVTEFVNIEYSVNNGSTWAPLFSNIANTGNFAWTIPMDAAFYSTIAKLRVSLVTQPTQVDESNSVFTIGPCPSLASNAGLDQSICGNVVTLAATATVNGSWSGGLGVFSNVNSAAANYTAALSEASSTVILTWTIADPDGAGVCAGSADQVAITFDIPATSNAGSDQTGICAGTPVNLNGSIGGSASNAAWTASVPGGTFSPDATALNAVYTPPAGFSTIVLTLTTNDPPGVCAVAGDALSLSFNTIANAGVDQTICAGSTVALTGTINGAVTTGSWSSGGTGSFNNPTSLAAIYTPSASDISAGTVTLNLTSDDPPGVCPAVSDQITIVINAPATSDAGPDQTVCAGNPITLSGIRGGSATGSTWSSNGSGFFSNASSLTATYTPSAGDVAAGTVTLTLVTNNPSGPCVAASDDMVITFSQNASADAGADQDICGSTTALSAIPAAGGIWSGGLGSFSNTSHADATYTAATSETGTTVILTWTLPDPDGTGPCTGSADQVAILFSAPATVSAGADQTLCAGNIATLAGIRGGSAMSSFWTASVPGGNFSPNSTAPGALYTPPSSAGNVTLILTTNDPPGACPAVQDTMEITVSTIVNAGVDQSVCAGSPVALSGSIGGLVSIAVWASSGTGTFNDPTALTAVYTPSAADIAAGLVTLTLMTNDPPGACPAASDLMKVIIGQAASISAGSDQTICSGIPVTLAGTRGGSATGSIWTASAGGGTFSPGPAALNATYLPPSGVNTIVLTLTSNDPSGACPAVSDQMMIYVEPAVTVSAGPDQAACPGNPVNLQGSSGGSATGATWSASVPGGTFTPNASALNAVYTPPAGASSVTLTFTTNDPAGVCTAQSDQMVISINLSVNANADQTICAGSPVALAGTRGGSATGSTWTTSGTGTFNNPALLTAIYTPSPTDISTGSVVLTLTTTGPCAAISDQMMVTINPAATVDAGTSQTVCTGNAVALTGTRGGAATTSTWTASATGGIFTPNASALNASYTPPSGLTSVTLTLTTNDPLGACPAVSDQMTITVSALVNAGTDKNICAGNPVLLSGNISGLVTTGLWTSTGTGTFSNASSLTTEYFPSAQDISAGSVVLILTSSTPPGGCPPVSDQLILNIGQPGVVNAGLDQAVCGVAPITLAGTRGGSVTSSLWTASLAGGVFTPNASALDAIYTPPAGAAQVILTLNASDPSGACPIVSDQMILSINEPAVVNAGTDQPLCLGSNNISLGGIIGGAATDATWTASVPGGIFTPDALQLNAVYTPPAGITANIILTLTSNDPVGICPAVSDQMVVKLNNLLAGSFESVSPGNNTVNVNLPTLFKWNPSQHALRYELTVWPTTPMPDTLRFENITGTQFQVTQGIEYGKSYQWRVKAFGECNEKTTSIKRFITKNIPDLTVDVLGIGDTVEAGMEHSIAWSVINQGLVATASNQNFTDQIYLSVDTLPGGDIYVGQKGTTATLAGYGGSYQVQEIFTIPASVLAGNYYVIVTSFGGEDLDPANNYAVSDSTLFVEGIRLSDLVLFELNLPDTVTNNSSVQISYRIKNLGDGPVNSIYYDRVSLSGSNNLTLADVKISQTGLDNSGNLIEFNELLPGDSTAISAFIQIPGVPAGNYTLRIRADIFNGISESAENNNTLEVPIHVLATPLPDLQPVQFTTLGANLLSGAYELVEWNLENIGTADIALNQDWISRVYISQASAFDVDSSILVGQIYTRANTGDLLPVDSTLAQSVQMFIPSGIFGPYYIYVLCNSDERLAELDLGNNLLRSAVPVNITPGPPSTGIACDNFFDACDISIGNGNYDYGEVPLFFDLTQATIEAGEQFDSDIHLGHNKSVWYRLEVPVTRWIEISISEEDNYLHLSNTDIGLSVFRSPQIPGLPRITLPGGQNDLADFTQLTNFGNSGNYCLEPGTYYIRFSANTYRLNTPIYANVVFGSSDESPLSPFKYDRADHPYQFGFVDNESAAVSFDVGCLSIDIPEEVMPSLGADYQAYSQTAWFVFNTDNYSDAMRFQLNGAPFFDVNKVGFKLYRGDPRTGSILSLVPLDSMIMERENEYQGAPYLDYYCNFEPNQVYAVQLFFHKLLERRFSLILQDVGVQPATGIDPQAPNELGVLEHNDYPGVYDRENDRWTIPPGKETVAPNYFACNALMAGNITCDVMPADGVYTGPGGDYNLSFWYTFELDGYVNLRMFNQIFKGKSLVRLFRGDVRDYCQNNGTPLSLVGESSSAGNAFGGGFTFEYFCFEAGTYSVQVLGWLNEEDVFSSILGTREYLKFYVQSQAQEHQFNLADATRVDRVNGGNPIQMNTIYTLQPDIFGCAPTILPATGTQNLCSGPAQGAVYRVINIAQAGSLEISFPEHMAFCNRLYRGDATVLGQPFNIANPIVFDYELSGNKPIAPSQSYFDAETFCITPGVYTLVSIGTTMHTGVINAPVIRLRDYGVSQFNGPDKAEDLGNITPALAAGQTIVSTPDVVTCESNLVQIDGEYPCNPFYDKLFFYQFYLDSPQTLEITGAAGCGGTSPPAIRLYGGKVKGENGQLDNLTKLQGVYSSDLNNGCKIGGCYNPPKWLSNTCQPLPAGWYTVVYYASAGSYDGLGNEYFTNSAAGQDVGIVIKPVVVNALSQYNRPQTARNVGNISWQFDFNTTGVTPATSKSFSFGPEQFTCALDTDDPVLTQIQTFPEGYNRVAYYVFNLTKESYFKMNLGSTAAGPVKGEIYPIDIRVPEQLELYRKDGPNPIPPVSPCASAFEYCGLEAGIYTLVVYIAGGDELNGAIINPGVYLEKIEPNLYDYASRAYDFGIIPDNGGVYYSSLEDLFTSNPTYPGRNMSMDFFTCKSSAFGVDPPTNELLEFFCHTRTKTNWYSFQVEGAGEVSVQVNNLTFGKGGTGNGSRIPLDEDVYYQYPFSVYEVDENYAQFTIEDLYQMGALDTTSSLRFVGWNSRRSPFGFCTPAGRQVKWSLDPCQPQMIRRYFVVVDMHTQLLPNAQMEVGVSHRRIPNTPSENDHFWQAFNINSVGDRNVVETLTDGTYEGPTSIHHCASTDRYDQNSCGSRTIWWKFESGISGKARINYDVDNILASLNDPNAEIALYKRIDLDPNDPASTDSVKLIRIPLTEVYGNGARWGEGCLNTGTYYVVLTGCTATSLPVRPRIQLISNEGDLCSNPVSVAVNEQEIKFTGVVNIDCHSWGDDFGEAGFTNTGCFFDGSANSFPEDMKNAELVKSSWFKFSVGDIGKSNLRFELEFENGGSAFVASSDIKYRVMYGSCGAMTAGECQNTYNQYFQLDCMPANRDYYIQVIAPAFVRGNVKLSITALPTVTPNCIPSVFPDVVSDFRIQNACQGVEICVLNNSTQGEDISYLWDFGDGSTSSSLAPCHVYPISGVPVIYAVTLTVTNNITGISQAQTREVIVYPPVAAVIGLNYPGANGNNFVSANTPVNFQTVFNGPEWPNLDYSWDFGNGRIYANAFEKNPAGIVYSPDDIGRRIIQLTILNGNCETQRYDTIYVIGDSTQTIPLCEGNSLTLGSNAQAAAYFWSTGGTTSQITVSEAGSYSVLEGFENGSYSSVTYVVNLSAPPSVSLGENREYCEAQSLSLAPVSASADIVSYLWSSGETTAEIVVNLSGQYWLEVTNAGGCTYRDSVLVVPISVTAGADQIICEGGSVSLSGQVNTLNGTGEWSASVPGGTFTPNAMALNAVYLPPSGVSSVVLTLSSTSCSTTADQVFLTINPATTANAGADQTICAGEAVTLSGIAGGAATGGNWTSSGAGVFNNPGNLSAVYTPSGPDIALGTVTLTLTAVDSTGYCASFSDEIVIVINPVATADAGVNKTICAGDDVILNGILRGAATAGNWTSSGTGVFSDAGSLSTTYTPSVADIEAGSVILTLTTENPPGPCPATSDQIIVTIIQNPLFDLGADIELPVGNSAVIGVTGFPPAWQYSWSSGQITPTIVVSTEGIYQLTVTNDFGCSYADTITVTRPDAGIVINLGPDLTICRNQIYLLDPGAFPGYTYEWSTGATSQSLQVDEAGLYRLNLRNAQGEVVAFDEINIQVINCVPDCEAIQLSAGALCRISGTPTKNRWKITNDYFQTLDINWEISGASANRGYLRILPNSSVVFESTVVGSSDILLVYAFGALRQSVPANTTVCAMPVDFSDVVLKSACTESASQKWWRITNPYLTPVSVSWNAPGTGENGTIVVPAQDTRFFITSIAANEILWQVSGESGFRTALAGGAGCGHITPPSGLANVALTPECTFTPATTRGWKINNPYASEVKVSWYLGGSAQAGRATIPAYGSIRFTTNVIPGDNRVYLVLEGVPAASMLHTGSSCSGYTFLLTSMCSANPSKTRRWRLRSTYAEDILVNWQLYGTSLTGSVLTKAGTDMFFETPTVGGANTLIIKKNGVNLTTKASGGATCSHNCLISALVGDDGGGPLESGALRPALVKNLYPNPTNGEVMVEFYRNSLAQIRREQTTGVDITVRDVFGRVLQELHYEPEELDLKLQFNLAAESSGIYTVEVRTGASSSIFKVLCIK